MAFEEKVKEIAREEKDLATIPEDELQRLLSSLLTIFYILESSNIKIFKINDVEMFNKEDDSPVKSNQQTQNNFIFLGIVNLDRCLLNLRLPHV